MKADRPIKDFLAPWQRNGKADAGADREKLERWREGDAALRRALGAAGTARPRYLHNFAFKTMERISVGEESKRRSSHVVGYAAATIVSIGAVVAFVWFMVDHSALPQPVSMPQGLNTSMLRDSFSFLTSPDFSPFRTVLTEGLLSVKSSVAIAMAFCFVFFAVLNRILSRYFMERISGTGKCAGRRGCA